MKKLNPRKKLRCKRCKSGFKIKVKTNNCVVTGTGRLGFTCRSCLCESCVRGLSEIFRELNTGNVRVVNL